tara:strand:+ start:2212 stop:2925 length:714 start_codon:yes stop_codon:yes gene_type:complete
MSDKVDAVQESIKLALDAADAATDVTSEYNTIRKQNVILEAKVKQIHKYTTVVFVSSIISGLFVVIVSAFLFMQGSSKLSSMTETSREALVVFAENVDSVNSSLKNLNEAIAKQGDLLEVNKKLVSTMKKIENKITKANETTVGELRTISNSLISELNSYSKKTDESNKKLNATMKNFSVQSGKALSNAMKKMSKNPIYNKIIANQTIQSQQITNLIKQNSNLVRKMKDKAAMIKYP